MASQEWWILKFSNILVVFGIKVAIMIIPSNIYLDISEKEKYEDFIKKNLKKIDGIFVLLNIEPFGSKIELGGYYKYIGELTKKYKLRPIGFFNETYTSKFSQTLKDDIIKFEIEFKKFYNGGITTIIRPYSWYNYNFFKFENLRFYIPDEPSFDMIRRCLEKDIFFKQLNYLENGITKKITKIDFEKSIYQKRLSIAHPDSTYSGDIFYKALISSNPKFLDEIDDIYFGKDFIYDDGFKYLKYGNVMGANASSEQIDYLFKIQDELGISISLTLNSMNPPPDLVYDKNVLDKFILFLKNFYDRGLRVVTISDIHLIKTGILQKIFPKMRFKNTVNHKIMDTQSFINFANLGYDYIQLDRSLNRDLSELKKIKEVNKKLGKKLYLLASEFCMYNCPFKTEHDNINQEILSAHAYFEGETKRSHISCDNWRMGKYASMPRSGVDLILKDKDALDEYLELVDVLKFSGRLVILDDFQDDLKLYVEGENSLEDKAKDDIKSRLRITLSKKNTQKEKVYDTPQGEKLLDILKICKNECYSCHLCEKVFGTDEFDSLIELNGDF